MQFKFGKKRTVGSIITFSIVFSLLISLTSKCTGIKKEDLEDVVDGVNRSFVRNTNINYEVLNNPKILGRRINRDVTSAIEDYHKSIEKSYTPRIKNQDILNNLKGYDQNEKIIIKDAIYYELPDKENTPLGRPMGIRAAWTDPHPEEISQ